MSRLITSCSGPDTALRLQECRRTSSCEWIWIEQGSGRAVVNGTSYSAQRDALFLVPPHSTCVFASRPNCPVASSWLSAFFFPLPFPSAPLAPATGGGSARE